MFCPKCGTQSTAINDVCPKCGYDFGLIPEHLKERETDTVYETETVGNVFTAEANAADTKNRAEKEKPISAYMLRSILLAVFGSIVFGIAAVIFSGMTQTELKSGNTEKAREYSEKTRMFCVISLIVGIVRYLFAGAIIVFCLLGL